MPKGLDVMQGTLDLLILKALAETPMHGWGISSQIRQMSRNAFRIGQGSLYPALHRLENRGWLTSYWRTTDNQRIARVYELTAPGKHQLEEEVRTWRSYASAVDSVLGAQ